MEEQRGRPRNGNCCAGLLVFFWATQMGKVPTVVHNSWLKGPKGQLPWSRKGIATDLHIKWGKCTGNRATEVAKMFLGKTITKLVQCSESTLT
jgi:hypothetical protein